MKLQNLIREVYYEPSLIAPSAHASIRRLLEARLGETLADPQAAQRQGEDWCGEAIDLPSMEIIDGIAHIPVGGAIGHKLNGFAKGRGAVDVADIEADIDEAEANPEVKGSLLLIDSPGGMVGGTPELAGRIAATTKPIYAYSDSLIASGAYWLASATDGIFTTLTASTGSIGVYLPYLDVSAAYAEHGYKVDLIRTGKYKGMGYPGTSLSEEQRAHLQERVDTIFAMFRDQVTSGRPAVKKDAMQGQTFLAAQAFEAGLIDGIVKDKWEVADLMR